MNDADRYPGPDDDPRVQAAKRTDRLKQIQGNTALHARRADEVACAAATTDQIADARNWAMKARAEAGSAYGCLMEARSICSRPEDEEFAHPDEKKTLEDVEWQSRFALAAAKDADNACIRLVRVLRAHGEGHGHLKRKIANPDAF